jgi:hypothetical protein
MIPSVLLPQPQSEPSFLIAYASIPGAISSKLEPDAYNVAYNYIYKGPILMGRQVNFCVDEIYIEIDSSRLSKDDMIKGSNVQLKQYILY